MGLPKIFKRNLNIFLRWILTVKVDVTRKEAEYLALLFRTQIEDGGSVTTTTLASKFDVSPATVTEWFQKLAEKNLVEYRPYYGVKLTKLGLAEAGRLLRRHRLLETLFVRFLKYSPIVACQEASKIDYYCSDALTNNICRTFNHPVACPCNKQIFREGTCRSSGPSHHNDGSRSRF